MNMFRLASLSLLLLFGCNDSRVPLGPPETAPMNIQLAGMWEPVMPPEEGGSDTMRILPFNDHEFYIEYTHLSDDGEPEIMRTRGFVTPIGDATFANVQLIEDTEDRNYLIFWFELSDEDTLYTLLIDEEMDHIETSEELRSLVKGLLDTNALPVEDMVQFRRMQTDN